MNDVFGYIAYGENELYHRGALLSALKLLHHCPTARITVATDRSELFRGYPIETMLITTEQKEQWSFGGRYHFGIKAGTMRELLRRADRLLFMDTDMYPVGDPSKGFHSISAIHSIMRLCEGKHRIYQRALPGKNISIGGQVLTGQEPMWNSGIVGIHRESLSAMVDAFAAIKVVHEVTDTWAPEQFCLGVALSQTAEPSARIACRSGTTTPEAKSSSLSRAYMRSLMLTARCQSASRLQRPVDIVCGGRPWIYGIRSIGSHCDGMAMHEESVSIQAALKRDPRTSHLWGEPEEGVWNVCRHSVDHRGVLFGGRQCQL
ncbi:hypothetical protein NLY34_21955 [Mesorhizobium sp. C374B]|uniref:hypothetical protein n=1 Tax=Mesorhizobium sp. C374B TaxID=2956830 RepID=UPI002575F4E4|nr:hypothetical protein [Mesorhizobium sp. C374B]WJI79513.1 hypothetical protein NLY34_21955 [Mesorhizobium sp. C374B]